MCKILITFMTAMAVVFLIVGLAWVIVLGLTGLWDEVKKERQKK